MDYVAPGTVIKLGANGVVVLGYLTSCWRETISGGVAIVGTEESKTSLGEVSREKVGCDTGRAQLSSREATQSAATTFRSIGGAKQAPAAPQPVIYGLSPIIELAKPGKLVIERIDLPGERIESAVTAKSLVKGKFYDLATAGKSLMPGGTYAATLGSQKTVFKVDRWQDRARHRSSAGWCACKGLREKHLGRLAWAASPGAIRSLRLPSL